MSLPDIYRLSFPIYHVASAGPVPILPLSGKPHWVLSSGSIFVCSVVNILLWVKHSYFCTLFLKYYCVSWDFSVNCDSILQSLLSVSFIMRREQGKGSNLSVFNFPAGF